MLNYIKKCEQSMLISTILTLVLGIILTIDPNGSIKIVTGVIALMFGLIGIFQLFEYITMSHEEKYMSFSLIIGVVSLIIGLLLFFKTDSLVKFITILIGISIGIKSLFKIQFALNLRTLSTKWFYNLFVGLITLALSILLIANPFESAELFLRIIGVVLIIGSVAEIVETIMVMNTIDDVKELEFVDKKDVKKKDKKDKKSKKHQIEIVDAEKVEKEKE